MHVDWLTEELLRTVNDASDKILEEIRDGFHSIIERSAETPSEEDRFIEQLAAKIKERLENRVMETGRVRIRDRIVREIKQMNSRLLKTVINALDKELEVVA